MRPTIFREEVFHVEKKDGRKSGKFDWSQLNAVFQKALAALRPVAAKVGRLSFLSVALLGLVLRLFITRPFGALLALTAGCIWMYYNIHQFKQLLLGLLSGLTRMLSGDVETSLWFEHGGRDKIRSLIALLSVQGVSYCNLAEQIEDLPPESHWCAISKGLCEMGIVTQVTRGAFFISWHLPRAGAADANAA